jgi:hypothetical protein
MHRRENIFLSLLDLTLTILATHLGFYEINPFIRFLVQIPLILLLVKLVIPVLIAWLMPGQVLIPSIAILALSFIWNIKELIFFLV